MVTGNSFYLLISDWQTLDANYFEWLAITNQYLQFYHVVTRSMFIINPGNQCNKKNSITGKVLF